MSDDKLIEKIISDLDSAIAAKKAQRGSRDCLDDCEKSYNSCMGSAGSNLEKAVCKADYNKCITNY
jgi:hypothetical protein